MTEWIMEDEEELREWCSAYKEARDAVDAAIPRGDQQTRWLGSLGHNQVLKTWLPAHWFWFDMRRELDDGR